MNEITGRRVALLVIVIGMVATIALQWIVPPVEVFWSGDAGLKNMMAKQYAHGVMDVNLHQTDEEWVAKLWAEEPNDTDHTSGLHPGVYGDYIYDFNGKYFGVFPYPFPFVSAPFYAMFGVRGYYIIPVVSLWLLWIVTYLAMRRANVESPMIAMLMFVFIFAMPITLYAAMFWEHTLGLLLALIPVYYTLRHDDFEPGPIAPTLAGLMLGVAVWFRPETMALIAALLPAAFIWRRRALGFRGWFLFSAASTVAVIIFFALNLWIYGHPLGTHGMQLGKIYPPPTRPDVVVQRFISLVKLCARFAPVGAFLVYLLAVLAWKRKLKWNSEIVFLFVVLALFFPLMVFMVPTDGGFQPGPRFAFIALVGALILCAYAWKELPQSRVIRGVGLAILLLTTLVGMKRNALDETRWVASEYQNRVLPAYEFVKDRPEKVVVVSHVAVTLELSELMDTKTFFAVLDDEDWVRLEAGLRKQGIDELLFIAFGWEMDKEDDSVLKHPVTSHLTIEPLGRHGYHFFCYSVKLPPIAETKPGA